MKKVNAETRVYGLIGYPVRHSKSPVMHNSAFEHLGINAVYLCFEVQPENLKKAIAGMRSLGIEGLNVTVPHKQKVTKYLDELTVVAKRIGAVNTIFRRGEKLIGTNTDAEGFIRDLRDTCRFSAKNKRIVVLGAGGASRAVTFALADAGAKVIYIFDIDPKKSRSLVRDLKRHYQGVFISSISKKNEIESLAGEIDLLVNATPVGMKEGDPPVIDLSPFRRDLLVYDLIYSPPLTPLLRQAKKLGMKWANGLGMLLWQGAIAFQHWFGRPAPIEVMRKALRRSLR